MTDPVTSTVRAHDHTTPWHYETALIAAQMWSKGSSASVIKAELSAVHGLEVTRSGVLGKMHRMGIRSPASWTRADRIMKKRRRTNRNQYEKQLMVWTPDIDQRMIELHEAGVQVSAIAGTINIGFKQSITYPMVRARLTELGKWKGAPSRRQATVSKGGVYLSAKTTNSTPGYLVDIVETLPSTSVAFFATSKQDCKWPTSNEVREMQVCGAPATMGAYCEHHGLLAYRTLPSPSRQARYFKREEFEPHD